MNNTIEHLSGGGFAVLPLPQAVTVQAGQLTKCSKCSGFGSFTNEVLNAQPNKDLWL